MEYKNRIALVRRKMMPAIHRATREVYTDVGIRKLMLLHLKTNSRVRFKEV